MKKGKLSPFQIYSIIRSFAWVAAGIIVLCFSHAVLSCLKYLVGTVMLVYGSESVLLYVFVFRKKGRTTGLYWGIAELILAMVLFLGVDLGQDGEISFVTVCVVWAIWAMLRESLEIGEAILSLAHYKTGLIELTVGVLNIVYSCLLVVNPTAEHAIMHVYLLAAELFGAGFLFPLERFLAAHYVRKIPWIKCWAIAIGEEPKEI